MGNNQSLNVPAANFPRIPSPNRLSVPGAQEAVSSFRKRFNSNRSRDSSTSTNIHKDIDEDEESGEKSEQSDDYNKGQIKVVVAEDSKKATAANSHRSRASTVAGASRSLRLRGRPHDKPRSNEVQGRVLLSGERGTAKNQVAAIPTMFVWNSSEAKAAPPRLRKASGGGGGLRSSNPRGQEHDAAQSERHQGPKEVVLSGSFNGWTPIQMTSGDESSFFAIVDLPEGKHQYKFRIDGVWQHNNKEPVVNDGMGGFNNVIKVHRDDMEVFKALDSDMADLAHRKFMHPVKVEAFSQSESGFTRDTPPWTNQLQPETVCGSGPPILPPQLGHVMLNKDTPLNCEPTLLPRPNHVMLNHLYAMSIKEQVMVLSMTSRHKSKYVTTILYRPV